MTSSSPVSQPSTSTAVHPARQARVAKALKYYSIMAWITGVWLITLCVEMFVKYIILSPEHAPSWFKYVGMAHGFVFMLYLISCLDLGTKARWEPSKWITTALAGVIPGLSFVVEKKRRQEVIQEFGLDAHGNPPTTSQKPADVKQG